MEDSIVKNLTVFDDESEVGCLVTPLDVLGRRWEAFDALGRPDTLWEDLRCLLTPWDAVGCADVVIGQLMTTYDTLGGTIIALERPWLCRNDFTSK